MKTTMWLVKKRDRIYNAYPRKLMAEVYASGFSNSKDIEIIEGYFITESASQPINSMNDEEEGQEYHYRESDPRLDGETI